MWTMNHTEYLDILKHQGHSYRFVHTYHKDFPSSTQEWEPYVLFVVYKEDSERLDATNSERTSGTTEEAAIREMMKRYPQGNPLDSEESDFQ